MTVLWVHLALTGLGLLSASSFDDRTWAAISWHRGAAMAFLAASLAFWVLMPFVPFYWLWLRPRLGLALRRQEISLRRS